MTEVVKAKDLANVGDYDIDIYNAIIIPRNATNGDILMALFNVEILFISEQINIITVRYDNHSKIYDLSWWNAPYNRESEK